MNCDQLETHLYPYLDGEYEAPERLEVEAHLAICRDCAAVVADEVHFRTAFRERMREVAQASSGSASGGAPASLRAAIQQGINREARHARVQRLVRLSAAAAVLLAAGGTFWALRPDPHRPFLDDAAQRHARGLPLEIEQTTPENVEAWFTGKLDHRVAVPQFPNLSLSGARIANVRDRPAAYITYQAEDAEARPRRVGLFVFTDTNGQLDARQLPTVKVDTSHGYNVALWRDGEIVYELVSDLDEDDIRQLVSSTARGGTPRPGLGREVRGEVQLARHEERLPSLHEGTFMPAQPQLGRVRHAAQQGPTPQLFTPPPMSHPQFEVRPVATHALPR